MWNDVTGPPPAHFHPSRAASPEAMISYEGKPTTRTPYQDLGGDYFLNRDNPDDRRRRAIAQLERLGYQVNLEPRAA